MKRLILHVGFGKCASSSLQGYLSTHPVLPLKGGAGVLRYVIGRINAPIQHGEEISKSIANNPFGYRISEPPLLQNPAAVHAAIADMRQLCGPEDIAVLSCEGWGNVGFVTPSVQEALNGLEVPVDVLMFTRPPVEWVNAAWWQWKAWADGTLESGLAELKRVSFRKGLDQWRRIKGVDRVAVRDVSQGAIAMFRAFAGVAAAAPAYDLRLNTATDFDLLRYLWHNRTRYGRTERSPLVEFRLNAHFGNDRRPLPFVVSRGLAHEIVESGQAENEALLALMQIDGPPLSDEVQRRYLDPAAYDHLPETVDLADLERTDYSEEFVGKLVDALLALGRQRAIEDGFLKALLVFDPRRYLDLNPDVRASGMNPYEHFLRFGFIEGRQK